MVRTRLKPRFERGQQLPIGEAGIVWEDVILNEVMGPVDYDIRAESHQKHCDLLNIHHPFFEAEQHLFPWEYFSMFRVGPQWNGLRINQGINTAAQYNFFKPAKVGQPITGVLMPVDKYERVHRQYLVYENNNYDENHELVSRIFIYSITMAGTSEISGRHEKASVRKMENWWAGGASGAVPRNSSDLPIGYELPNHLAGPLPMRVSGHKPGGWDSKVWIKNIHTDEYARSMGFKAALVEAPIVTETGLLTTLVDFYGPDAYFTTGKLDLKIAGPGYVGDTLVGKFRIRERQQEGPCTRTVLDVRIEKESGELCQVGTASALDRIPDIED